MLKWMTKTSLLCLCFGVLFFGSTRLEYAGSKISLYNVSQWNVSGQHSVVAGCYIVVWQSSGYYEIASYLHPCGHNAFMKLISSAHSSECQLHMATFQGVVYWVSNNRGWQLLIKGGVWENSHVCFPVHVRVKRRVGCSCVPSILDTQSIFHLWPNQKKARLECR